MNIRTDLLEIIERARAAANRQPSGRRELAGADAEERLISILAEIGETTLPRQLVFSLGALRRLVVEAGDRKLRAVVEIAPAELANPDIGLPPAGSRPRRLAAAYTVLSAFAESDGVLTVTPLAPEHFRSMSLDGLAPDDILAAEGMVPPDEPDEAPAPAARPATQYEPHPLAPPPDHSTPSGMYYSAVAGFTQARAITAEDGGVADKDGDDQAIPLEYLVRTFAAQIQMNSPFTDTSMPGPKTIFMGTQTADMPSVVCFDDGAHLVVATLTDRSVDQTLDSAARILGDMTPRG